MDSQPFSDHSYRDMQDGGIAYWKRRCAVLQDRVDQLTAELMQLKGFSSLLTEDVRKWNERVRNGHGEIVKGEDQGGG
jgi:hypothetical protein